MSVLPRRPIRYFGATKNLELRKLIHTRGFIASNRDNIRQNTDALIDLYSKSEALMSGHFQNGSAFEVVRLFKSMVSESCPPNEYISGLVLSSCLNVRLLSLGRQCHGYLLKSGLVLNQYMKTTLVRLYSMLSDVVGAMEVSVVNCNRELQLDDYNVMLVGLVEKGYLDEALIILRRKLLLGGAWNKDSYIGVLGLCGRLKDLNMGRQVHNKLLKSITDVEFDDESVCSAMMNMYGKCGDISSARQVFDKFEPKSVVILNTMLGAYLEHGSLEHGSLVESFVLFLVMHYYKDAVPPNESSFCVLVTLSAEFFSLRLGKSVHALVEKTGFKGDKQVQDSLIDMYSRTGDINTAEKVFYNSNDCDITTWNAMINGYSLHGFGNEALALFEEMLRLGEDDPNDATFVGVLSACGHMGLVEQGFYYFYELMEQKGVKPGLEHHMCIINMLIKAGRLSEALSLIVSTPSCKRDALAWTALLSGCRDHGNYSLGIRVADLIPDDVASKVSKTREDTNTKEERGMGFVEIRDFTHGYDSVDKGDTKFGTYRGLMKVIFGTIRCFFNMKLGIDVEDEMKRDSEDGYILGEEIAVAYALLETPLKAPICVIKSCGKIDPDFHSLMKLLSKASVRPITVRDAYQFHHFQDGSCSCADYW